MGNSAAAVPGSNWVRDRDNAVTTRILDGFEDPMFGREQWEELVRRSDTDVVYLTWQWQRSWWETLGRGHLLLIVAERCGRPTALAPFYVESGMVGFVGTGDSEYLDFIGDVADPPIIDALLEAARAAPEFAGLRLSCVPEGSRTGPALEAAARRLGMECYEECRWPAPHIDLAAQGAVPLRHREQFFRRRGGLHLRRFIDAARVLPQLEEFLDQHIARWALTSHRSPFVDEPHRRFIEQLIRSTAPTLCLRFARLEWEGRPIAFECGWCYRGTYFGGPSSFAVDLARRSPGSVLLRQLVLAAREEGLTTYDLGAGDEPYKFLFATRVKHAQTWGLYPAT